MSMFNTGFIAFQNYTSYDIGSINWSNLSNLSTNNGVYATTTPDNTTAQADYAVGNSLGSAQVKTGSHIKGIEIIYEPVAQWDDTRYIYEDNVKIFINGIPIGDNKATSVHYPTAINNTFTRGGDSDLWGVSANWNDVLIKEADFGVGFSFSRVNPAGDNSGGADYFHLNVYYNPTGMFMAM